MKSIDNYKIPMTMDDDVYTRLTQERLKQDAIIREARNEMMEKSEVNRKFLSTLSVFDHRNLEDMIIFEEGWSDDQKKQYAREYIDNLINSPEKRKEYITAFLNRRKEFDIQKYDLSVMTGSEKTGEEAKKSQESYLKLYYELRKVSQPFDTTIDRFSDIYEEAFPTKRERGLLNEKGDCVSGISPALMTQFVMSGMNIDEGTKGGPVFVDEGTALDLYQKARLCYEHIQQVQQELAGEEAEHTIGLDICFAWNKEENYALLKWLENPNQWNPQIYPKNVQDAGKIKRNAAIIDNNARRVSDTFKCMLDTFCHPIRTQGKYFAQMGLDAYDVVMIDGKSARDFLGSKGFDVDKIKEKNGNSQENIKANVELMKAMLSGEHHVDMAMFRYNKEDKLEMTAYSVKPDIGRFYERKRQEERMEHNVFRRALDYLGIWKIKTKADKIREMAESDPAKEERTGKMKEAFKEKLAAFNKKETASIGNSRRNISEELGISQEKQQSKKTIQNAGTMDKKAELQH